MMVSPGDCVICICSELKNVHALQGVPLLYVPLEVVMSKYYGESERLMGQVFSLANQLPDGAIVFLDEVNGTSND